MEVKFMKYFLILLHCICYASYVNAASPVKRQGSLCLPKPGFEKIYHPNSKVDKLNKGIMHTENKLDHIHLDDESLSSISLKQNFKHPSYTHSNRAMLEEIQKASTFRQPIKDLEPIKEGKDVSAGFQVRLPAK